MQAPRRPWLWPELLPAIDGLEVVVPFVDCTTPAIAWTAKARGTRGGHLRWGGRLLRAGAVGFASAKPRFHLACLREACARKTIGCARS